MTTYRRMLKDDDDNNILPVTGYNDNYSTTEIDTGYTWVDGKHIYKRTYHFEQLPNNSAVTKALGFTNLDSVVKLEGIAQSSSVAIPICYAAGGSNPTTQVPYNVDMAYIASTNSLRITTGTDRTALHAYITIYYTKTS